MDFCYGGDVLGMWRWQCNIKFERKEGNRRLKRSTKVLFHIRDVILHSFAIFDFVVFLYFMIVVGGIIPKGDYKFLRDNGAAAIFGPGTPIPEAAIGTVDAIDKAKKAWLINYSKETLEHLQKASHFVRANA